MTLQQLINRSMTATFAMLVMATAAHAFSDEAIKDAQKLLDYRTQQFQAGTAGIADVARARYELLDMRRRAGKLAHAAFCKAAQGELKLVVARFEEGDGQAGEKAKWQGEIAGMTKSAAACDRAAATADQLIYGFSAPTHSQAGVKDAEDRVGLVQQRVAAGTARTRDLEQAQYQLLVQKYGARQISLKDYCKDGLRHLGMIDDLFEQALREGTSDIADVIGARFNLHRLKATCRAK